MEVQSHEHVLSTAREKLEKFLSVGLKGGGVEWSVLVFR